ncbi:type II secretion system protein N [Comamonas composti]|uniref:type II secretion system protein N n=1 Tax=Comamonas composti TaxID=408558 RepID=UPI00041396B0|nr:type II secretion system protein N [Comamonas composti]
MVTFSLKRGQPRARQPGAWPLKLATFAFWALAAGLLMFWGMRLLGPAGTAELPVRPAPAPRVDAQAMAQALGAAGAAQAVPEPVAAAASRYALVGVLAGRDSGAGAAVIAVGSAPPKPFRVGAKLEDGVVLQSVSTREARLGSSLEAPVSITLQLPLPGKR